MSVITRKARRRIQTASVVLDSLGLVRNRNGAATLRLKLVGPVAKLQELKIREGDRMRVHERTVSAP